MCKLWILMCYFIDSVWSRCTPCNTALKRNATSTYICRLAADRTDTHWWTYKQHLSFFLFFLVFCVKLQVAAFHPWQSIAYASWTVGLSRSEITRWCTVGDFCVHVFQSTCGNHSRDMVWHQRGVVSTVWIALLRTFPVWQFHRKAGCFHDHAKIGLQ